MNSLCFEPECIHVVGPAEWDDGAVPPLGFTIDNLMNDGWDSPEKLAAEEWE